MMRRTSILDTSWIMYYDFFFALSVHLLVKFKHIKHLICTLHV